MYEAGPAILRMRRAKGCVSDAVSGRNGGKGENMAIVEALEGGTGGGTGMQSSGRKHGRRSIKGTPKDPCPR